VTEVEPVDLFPLSVTVSPGMGKNFDVAGAVPVNFKHVLPEVNVPVPP
jgi:hypothetical protein